MTNLAAIDIEICPECGGKLRVIACIEEPLSVRYSGYQSAA